jgi:Fe-S oxidoreductase
MREDFDEGVALLNSQIDARVSSYFSSCVHCGLCAEACLFFTETGNPRYTPIYKLEPMRRLWFQRHTLRGRLAKWLGMSKELTREDFAEWEELVYDSCTMCGRCSMVCPVGNDIAYMIRREREGFSKAGYAPEGMKMANHRSLTIGSPMGVTLKTLQATLAHVEKSIGAPIPIDRQGADYITLFSSMEVVNFP